MTQFAFSVGERVYIAIVPAADGQPRAVGTVRQRYVGATGVIEYYVEWQTSEDSAMQRAWLETWQLEAVYGGVQL